MLSFDTLPDWKTLELFEREASALAALRAQGVPRFYAHEKSKDGQTLLLAQELIEGPTLAERIAQERLTETKARTLCVALLNVIHELSEATPPIVHRDVKPSNVIIGHERVHLV
ncbi:MAG: serine/threonine protein kinase, partial [Bradymonadia bacterium]